MKLLNEKIKVDRHEYESLLRRVEELEDEVENCRLSKEFIFKNWRFTNDKLYEMMEKYFNEKVQTVIVARDRERIIAELRTMAMNNIFDEGKK